MREINKTTKNKFVTKVVLLFLFALMIITINAKINIATQNLMGLQGDVNLEGVPVQTGNLTVLIWNQSTGGQLIYNSTSDYLNSIIEGRFDVMLGNGTQELILEYGKIYYMDLRVNNQDLDFDGIERRAFQSNVGNITSASITPSTITNTQIADGTITTQKLSTISKSKINTTNTWIESEIPSLSASWTGTIDSSRISSQTSLNVNNSEYLQGYSATAFLTNDSSLSSRINTLNSTKANIGTCSSGQVIMNITSTGVECVTQQGGQTFNQNLDTTSNVQFRNITASNISSTNLFGNLNWSYLLNIPSFVKDYASDLSLKLDLTDQRYNDTTKINSINTTANIQNLGFNTTTQLNNIYYGINNINNFVNITIGDNRYLIIADQRYNESTTITTINNSLNTETTNRQNNDTTLSAEIDSVNTSLINEIGNRTAADENINLSDVRLMSTDANPKLSNSLVLGRDAFLFDDFLSGAVSGRYIILGTQSANVVDTNNWGVYNYATGITIGNDAGFSIGGSTTTTSQIFNITNVIKFELRAKLVATTGQRTYIGLMKTATSQNFGAINEGAVFFYDSTSNANWSARNCKAGTCTDVNTNVSTNTNFHTFTIKPSTSGVAYYIDGVFITNITTNVPTARVAWIGMETETTDTTADNTRVDYVLFEATR
ncbi:MAG: hypothetical protein WC758_04105 [Candidatus Woesearchaeota archaeon]|jgi:hypothetical protein